MNYQNSVGVVLLLLLGFAAAGGASGGGAAAAGAPGFGVGSSPLSPPLYPPARPPARPPVRPPHPAALAKDFHRMVGIMGKVDGLGQMALNPPNLPNQPKPPNFQKSAEPESLINASALPDLSGIMNMLAPIMSGLSPSQGE